MNLRIALAGNPNCGKTTLFNALTGSNQYVGNWPGVTVEKKEGKLKKQDGIIVTDLPGIYSFSPYTPEEIVARSYLVEERPDVILNIVDGTNLERNLYLTTQLMELGIPVVIAINMMDVVRKNGDAIDIEKLSKGIGCKIIEISALKGEHILEAAELAIAAAKEGAVVPGHIFSGTVEHALAHIEEAAVHHLPEDRQRWYAVKLFERDLRVAEKMQLPEATRQHMEADIAAVEAELDDDAESIITNERYLFIDRLMQRCYQRKHAGRLSVSDRIDRVVTNRFLALPIFALVMWLVYTLSIGTVGDWTVGFMNDGLFGSFAENYGDTFMANWVSIPELFDRWLLNAAGEPVIAPWLYSLIQDGIIGGVGAVLGFVPQMMILFLLLSMLEDCGYMSRVAFIMDRIFRKFGLSGKSFIPLLVATGCGVPGIMASRTIEQERDRRMTIMTTAFIPCGAKMPIVGMIAGALFADTWLGGAWVATAAYFLGMAAVVISGLILKKTKVFAGDSAPFVMELPAYHMPVASNVLRATWERGWDFIKRAGTVILVASVAIWVLNSFSLTGGLHYIAEGETDSILNIIGSALAWVFKPLGFGSWQMAVATVLGLMAKEEVVGVFGALASMANSGAAEVLESGSSEQMAFIGQEFFGGNGLSGFSFMVFNLLCAPCFAAMGAIRREMNSRKWTWAALGWMTGFAYVTSLIVYQLGSFFAGGGFSFWTMVALILLVVLVYLVVRKNPYRDGKQLKK